MARKQATTPQDRKVGVHVLGRATKVMSRVDEKKMKAIDFVLNRSAAFVE
jgi:hypothetical protein